MSRVRHYFSYDEALAEWRRFGLPENFMDRRRMLGSIFVVQDGMDREEAVRLQDAIKAKGGEAFLCRKIRSGKVMMVGAPFFFEQLAMDAGAVGHYGMEIASAIRNYHSDYTVPVPLAKRELRFDRTLVMGVLNVTPDSFSDGGSYVDLDAAVERAMQMAQEGADIIDIGGESTRPGAEPVAEKVEMVKDFAELTEILRTKSRTFGFLLDLSDIQRGVAERAAKARSPRAPAGSRLAHD